MRLAAILLASTMAASAGAVDTVLVNGKVVRFDAPPASAVAVRAGRIVAVGSTAEVRKLATRETRVVDLGGRTVIPGLVDSHIHAIRAGLTYRTEVHWIGARSIREALDRLRAAARVVPKGEWLVVAGGWIETQFAERRVPTQAEIAAAAPDHRVYVQRLYTGVVTSPGALEALGLLDRPELASRLKIETDASGAPTGWVHGDARTISDLFDLLPRPSLDEQVAGTRAFFRELNSLGLTGVIDPGGYNLPVDAYRALHRVWRDGTLTLRVVWSLSAPTRDREREDFERLTALVPMGAGDDLLRFNGIGENVAWGMYNNDAPSPEQKARLLETLRWASSRGYTATFHWNNDRSVGHLLDVLEDVDRTSRIASLRWSIAHLNDASDESLRRMRALGVGWLVQNGHYFRGEIFTSERGEAATRRAPPLGTALRMGLPIGAGTDAHRVMDFNPFVSLQWMVDGRTVGGASTRAPEERLTRLEALRLYTLGSAWFAHDERRRGEIEVGRLADLAVLDADYLTVPVERIGRIRSMLTMVGGRIVHAVPPFAPRKAPRHAESP